MAMPMIMPMPLMMLLGLSLGLLIASPQLVWAWQYYRQSIRRSVNAQEKIALGSVPLWRLLQSLVWTRNHSSCDGVLYPEVACYIGLIPLALACQAPLSLWHGIAFLSAGLAMGRHLPLFRWTHWAHLRIPARYCYFLQLSLSFLTLEVLSGTPLNPIWWFLTLLLAWDLLMNTSPLMSHVPYLQRWEQPSAVCETALTRFLATHLGKYRVSGLPYPLRTGQLQGFKTLGYTGASQLAWMARFRQEQDPNGSGAHDWFLTHGDDPLLDWYGVKYAFTYRPLTGKWTPTAVPHLYENIRVSSPVPTWKEVATRYGAVCASGNAV